LEKPPARRDKRWPSSVLRRLLDVLLQVCQAWSTSTRAASVHRDLKPANIMVGDFGEVLVDGLGRRRSSGHAPTDRSGSRATASRRALARWTTARALARANPERPPPMT
jgi:serine/threonine protein kinase